MKAVVTIIDDDGNILLTNKLIPSTQHHFDGIADIYEFRFEFAMAREKLLSFNYLVGEGEQP